MGTLNRRVTLRSQNYNAEKTESFLQKYWQLLECIEKNKSPQQRGPWGCRDHSWIYAYFKTFTLFFQFNRAHHTGVAERRVPPNQPARWTKQTSNSSTQPPLLNMNLARWCFSSIILLLYWFDLVTQLLFVSNSGISFLWTEASHPPEYDIKNKKVALLPQQSTIPLIYLRKKS